MKKTLSILTVLLMLPLMAVDVYLAGDSTMADYPASRAPMTGWGQALRRYAKEGVKVHNLACPGKSTKSFRNEGRWTTLLNQVSPGDYVFIQFGHNDANPKSNSRADADTEYKENMRRFIRDVKAKKANPVICTSIVWMSYRNGKISQSEYFGKYSEVARNVAAEENVALIDLNEWSKNELTKVGAEKAGEYYMILEAGKYPFFPKGARDTCHLQENGAHFYAKGMISLARAQKLEVAELFNDIPVEKSAPESAKNPDGQVNFEESFHKFVTHSGSAAQEESFPWRLICTNGAKIPLCNDGILCFDHTVGELRLFSEERITTGKFKIRLRINELIPPCNAFIGQISITPWMKHGASFHFNNPRLRANIYLDGKRNAAPPLQKGKWHDLEIIFTEDTITYLLDGKELFSGAAPVEKVSKAALIVLNCRNGGKINMDIDSISLTGSAVR